MKRNSPPSFLLTGFLVFLTSGGVWGEEEKAPAAAVLSFRLVADGFFLMECFGRRQSQNPEFRLGDSFSWDTPCFSDRPLPTGRPFVVALEGGKVLTGGRTGQTDLLGVKGKSGLRTELFLADGFPFRKESGKSLLGILDREVLSVEQIGLDRRKDPALARGVRESVAARWGEEISAGDTMFPYAEALTARDPALYLVPGGAGAFLAVFTGKPCSMTWVQGDRGVFPLAGGACAEPLAFFKMNGVLFLRARSVVPGTGEKKDVFYEVTFGSRELGE